MSQDNSEFESRNDDERTLRRMGYSQELLRRMSGFSNYAISLSIICILAGGVTSFHVGLCSVGGAAIGLGWPLVCAFSLVVALTMGQVASAFPTAGGLYHWASILGGRGWGWITAWFNLVGLITVMAAINVGLYQFIVSTLFREDPTQVSPWVQHLCVTAITVTQAFINHRGIRLTVRLTDFSGYWIVLVAFALTVAILLSARGWSFGHLIEFRNLSGAAGGEVFPPQANLGWLFMLGFLLPAYTITGFDASAHTSEETVRASENVPRSIVRSVLVSGVAGWVMLSAVVVALPDVAEVARHGPRAFPMAVESILPDWLGYLFYVCIALAQFLCGLATVTSASRMTYAFARDRGLPFSNWLRLVSDVYRVPAPAIWTVAVCAIGFTLYSPIYTTITMACVLFLYISYVIPTVLGFFAFRRSWTAMGPWDLGSWYRPLAAVAVGGCSVLVLLGMAPPNELAGQTLLGACVLLGLAWVGLERRRFPGPPPLDRAL